MPLPRARWSPSVSSSSHTTGTCATRGPSGVAANSWPKPSSLTSARIASRSSQRNAELGCISAPSCGPRASLRLTRLAGLGSRLRSCRLAPAAARLDRAAVAAFALAFLAHVLGVLLGPGLLLGLGRRRRLVERHHVAEHLVEPELRQALGEMLRQFGLDVDLAAIGMIDRDAPRMEVHLAADPAGQERRRAAIFAVADDRMADRRHVDAQLVRAAGIRACSSTQAVELPARSITR